MADEFGINGETIRQILVEDLGKRKVASRFVPRSLSDDQRHERVQYAKDIIKTARRNKNFFNSIVAQDETWCFRYDPTTKCQSAEWKSPASPKGKKVRPQKSKVKTVLVCSTTAWELFTASLSLRNKLSLKIFVCSGTPMEEDSLCPARVLGTRQLVSSSQCTGSSGSCCTRIFSPKTSVRAPPSALLPRFIPL